MSPRGVIRRTAASASDRVDPLMPAALAVVALALFAVPLFGGVDVAVTVAPVARGTPAGS
jgi:hypothetical protein